MGEQTILSEWRVNEDLSLVTLTPNEAQQRRQLMIQFIRDAMKEGRDFGIIPGTNQRSLWKPGAEKLCTFFGYSTQILPVESVMDWTGKDHGGEPFFFFRHKCIIRHGAVLIGDSEGSCNSWEKKYRYREGRRKCPKCGHESVYKSKPRENDPPGKPMGFYCWTKKGGCGATFPPGDATITSQQVGQVKNDEIFDQVNTIQKMSEKRALVGTTVIACNASEFFALDFDEEGDYNWLDDTRPVITKSEVQEPQTQEKIIENGKKASIALRGDQGDIVLSGPQWTEYPTDHPAIAKTMTDRPAEPPAETNTNGSSVKFASLKYQPFVGWCNEWVKGDARAAQYAKENGGANMYLILGGIAKLGFTEVTEENAEQIKAALIKSVETAA